METTRAGIPLLDDDGPKSKVFRPMPESFLERPIFALFEEVALENPLAIAIQSASGAISYGVLLERARAIASRLMVEGESGEPVALALPVDWQYLAAMLGCLAAGRPYVPLDLRHPRERREWILEHSGASVMLADGASQRIGARPRCRVIELDGINGRSSGFEVVGEASTVAYILYTSGSTGRPKGVFQDQRGLVHDVRQYTHSIHLGREDVSSLLYSPSVNGAIRDIYGTLLNGACLCMGDLSGEGFETVIERATRCGITLLHAMPPVLRSLLRVPGAREMLRRVRLAYVAGDRFLTADVRLLREALPDNAFLYTGIGSTECATLYRQWFVPGDWPLDECSVLPVGRAIPGREVMITSTEGEELPLGETGVIHVRGRYMARGYWRDPELTARTFVGPESPGAYRVFKTGDLGRIREDGLLEFVGRADRQVKIRGFRVDPSESEAVLRSLPGIQEAAVLVLELGGVSRLVGCVEISESAELGETTIVEYVNARLPSHLVPSRVLVSRRLPRLPNFKLDQIALSRWAELALKESEVPCGCGATKASCSETRSDEVMSVQILREWEEILGRSVSGIDVTWREAGGDSLQALEVLSAIERRLGRKLTTEMIRADATPASMAEGILQGDSLLKDLDPAVPRIHGKFWVVSSSGSVSVHDRRLVELLADIVDGDVLHITSMEDELERLRTIRELAEECMTTVISRTEPGVPVFLMGLSFGARVAFEMALLLKDRGFPVSFVGIGDIPVDARATRVESVPGAGFLFAAKGRFKGAAIDCVEWLTAHRHQWAVRWYMRAGRKVFGERFAILSGLAVRRGQAVAWKPSYFEGDVTLFVSAARGRALVGLSPMFGWEHLATSVARVDVAGTHETYHRDEQAAGFAEAIRASFLNVASKGGRGD